MDFVLGLERNAKLVRIIGRELHQAQQRHAETKQAARVFTEFSYRMQKSWSRQRRVVAKAEQLEGKQNPRYVVTNLGAEEWPAQKLYEDLYCARGEMHNRIKKQLSLFATRVSAEILRANQLRLYFAAAAYVLLHGLFRPRLPGQ